MGTIDRIKDLAEKRGMKMKFLTDSLGLNASYFSNVKSGKTQISRDRLEILANLLNTTADYLACETNYPYPDTSPNYAAHRADYDAELAKLHKELLHPKTPEFDYDRFNERRIARHLTPDYVEAQLNLPEDYWEDVRDGYVIPDTQLINKLAVLLETTYDYLMGLTDNPEIPLDDRTGVKIKLFGEVAAGIPIKQIDNFDPDDESSWEEINRSTAKNGTYFALRIKGDSMATRIQNGDRVIVRYQETVESGQTAVVAINGDTATCKKVIWDEQGGMILMSNNPAYAPRYFTAEQIQKLPVRILGRVVEIRGEP